LDTLNFKKADLIAIIANDAGAANLILGWIRKNNLLNYCFCLDGPAYKIFKDANLLKENLDFKNAINRSNKVITGTSHSSSLEHEARIYSKKLNKLSIAVIDHWVNYEIRFVRNGKQVLPDLIWVFDEYAERIAINTFEKTLIKRQNNYYLEYLVEEIKKIQIKEDYPKVNILYVLEPIRKNSSREIIYEFEVLNYFLSKIKNFNFNKKVDIKLRLHPSENKHKYQKWLNRNQRFNLSFSLNKRLEKDIAWSDIVVGYESFALVIASAASKRCYSSKLPHEGNSRLMIKDLEYLRDLD